MKPINEFILEQLEPVNESFQSSIVEKWKAASKRSYGWNSMMRQYKWDEITDNDLVWHDQAEAKKLAYKRNETWTLFWVDSQDNLIGYSTGNYSWNVFDSRYWKMKSIMPMVRDSKGAYSIDEKFETKELHRARQEAKANATALMENERIKEENLKRYENILKDKKMASGEIYVTIKSRFDEATEKYKQLFDEVGSADEENFKAKLDMLRKISAKYSDVLKSISDVMYRYELEKTGFQYSGIMSYIDSLENEMNRFRSMFNE